MPVDWLKIAIQNMHTHEHPAVPPEIIQFREARNRTINQRRNQTEEIRDFKYEFEYWDLRRTVVVVRITHIESGSERKMRFSEAASFLWRQVEVPRPKPEPWPRETDE